MVCRILASDHRDSHSYHASTTPHLLSAESVGCYPDPGLAPQHPDALHARLVWLLNPE